MNDDRQIERFLERFGDFLEDAEHDLAPKKRGHFRLAPRFGWFGVTAGLGTLAAAVLALVPASSSTQSQILSQAQAALSPAGSIIHMVVHTSLLGHNTAGPVDTQQWSAPGPRWRFVQRTGDERLQVSYANGTQDTYSNLSRVLSVRKGFGPHSPAEQLGGPFGSDPVADLRAMLAAHALKVAGQATVHGRRALRLTGRQATRYSVRIAAYLVDSKTFAPLGGTLSISFGGGPAQTIKFDVLGYERLPASPFNLSQLAIPIGPTDKVIIRDHPKGTPRLVSTRSACASDIGPARCKRDG